MTNCSSHQERKDSSTSIAAAVTTSAAATAEAAASSVLAGTASSNSGFLKPSSGVSPGDDLPSVFAKNVSKNWTLHYFIFEQRLMTNDLELQRDWRSTPTSSCATKLTSRPLPSSTSRTSRRSECRHSAPGKSSLASPTAWVSFHSEYILCPTQTLVGRRNNIVIVLWV